MADVCPFRGIRPRDALAGEIIAPPYDVLSGAEARAIAGPNPRSFLHVTRPDVDLQEGVDIHGPAAYAQARRSLDAFMGQGWMLQDERACFYLYAQTWQGSRQVGLMASCSVAEYDQGLIKKHELTRPDKEQDRVEHVEALDAQTGLVFLAYRDDSVVRAALDAAAGRTPSWTVDTDDGVTHALTVVDDPELVARIQAAFAQIPALYIADGHHRSAAASRVCAARGGAGNSDRFLAGLFPDSQLRVLAYNRLVQDLNGRDPQGFLADVATHFEITAGVDPVPAQRGRWTMYLGGTWYGLAARSGVVPFDDPVGALDVAVLQDRVLGPLLGVDNPRTDTRIRFVGGIRGVSGLAGPVDRGEAAVAFYLYPTGMDQLFAVADADLLMPPKSTWFEPKLRGGVVLHRFA